jgi:ribosomal protein L37AE/L43A
VTKVDYKEAKSIIEENHYMEMFTLISASKTAEAAERVSKITGIDTISAKALILDIQEDMNKIIPTNSTTEQSQINIPHCPTCNSTNIKRISTTAKVTNIAMFGLLGNKRKKTYHCNNCKYEW